MLTVGYIDGQTDIQIEKRTYGWTEGNIDGHIDGQKDIMNA